LIVFVCLLYFVWFQPSQDPFLKDCLLKWLLDFKSKSFKREFFAVTLLYIHSTTTNSTANSPPPTRGVTRTTTNMTRYAHYYLTPTTSTTSTTHTNSTAEHCTAKTLCQDTSTSHFGAGRNHFGSRSSRQAPFWPFSGIRLTLFLPAEGETHSVGLPLDTI
jgi:hypothetical protein